MPLGTLKRDSGYPVFLFQGYECQACESPALLIRTIKDSNTITLQYPGTITSKEMVVQSGSHQASELQVRAFFGKCLKNKDQSLVDFEEARDAAGKVLSRYVHVFNLLDDGTLDSEEHSGLSVEISETLAQVKVLECKEILGVDRVE